MNLFSKNLRFLRKKSGLNQEAISRLFHKRPNTVGNWENQKSEPSLGELIRLAEYFQVSTEALLHSDLENPFPAPGPGPMGPVPVYPDIKSGLAPEPGAVAVSESSPDAFWSILRELRTLHAKLDILQETLRYTVQERTHDKSSH
jgi:transcriptional regulator with XRE-family HTH domain